MALSVKKNKFGLEQSDMQGGYVSIYQVSYVKELALLVFSEVNAD